MVVNKENARTRTTTGKETINTPGAGIGRRLQREKRTLTVLFLILGMAFALSMAVPQMRSVALTTVLFAKTDSIETTGAKDTTHVKDSTETRSYAVQGLEKAKVAPPATHDDILWLARGIYSETKQSHEQELVAWVIRNRVETKYRGKSTYKKVVLDPYQFSAFNPNDPKREQFISLSDQTPAQGFEQALRIAEEVALADTSERPFGPKTRHFYSEQSMVGGKTPNWAVNKEPVDLDRDVDPRRFRFYEDIS